MKKYAIMGGTFNPIHMGHLMISEYIRSELNIDKIVFIPTGDPPHKKTIDAVTRYEMVKLAIEDNDNFIISDIETKREGYSYSIDTINILTREIKAKFYFIIGSDTLFELKTWKNIQEVVKKVEFVCTFREKYMDYDKLNFELEYLSKIGAKINLLDAPIFEISSTDLRNRISKGKTTKYLIPDKVIDYIEKKNLYRG